MRTSGTEHCFWDNPAFHSHSLTSLYNSCELHTLVYAIDLDQCHHLAQGCEKSTPLRATAILTQGPGRGRAARTQLPLLRELQ